MALSERYLKSLKPTNKPKKLSDINGLSILIKPNGSKLWQLRYIYMKKEKTLSLGKYPLITLQEAREKTLEARKLLQEGLDPSAERKKEKMLAQFNADNSFASVAEEWFHNNKTRWTARHAQRLWRRIEIHIFPGLGKRPISDITTLELLNSLRMIENRGNTETSHRALQTCRLIFRFAVLSQKIKYNPAIDLQGVLMAHKANNYPTIKQSELPSFLNKLETHNISQLNRLAIKFLMLTMVRQGEMRQAKWGDIDYNRKEWRVRAETTKMRAEHRVPLSTQAMATLEDINKITGNKEYIFASQQPRKNSYMSENTINKVLHGMGYKGALVAHGFRSLASTILNEIGQFNPDAIERQLAHMPRDKVRAAYNRAEYMQDRVSMMQWWADYIDAKEKF